VDGNNSHSQRRDGNHAASAPSAPMLPGLDPIEMIGKLIVIEGPDGSGRSTQIMLLQEWLESAGFAVQTIGLRRSNLLARDIDGVLSKNVAGRLTIALLYATDFFDQLQNVMAPALRAGHVVLADRYTYSLIARSAVRGIDPGYLEGIYNLAIPPDLTFWLNVSPEEAFDREFKKSQAISYWESGRDLNLADDLYESFVLYQSLLRNEFDRLASRNGFIRIDGRRSIPKVNASLRRRIAKSLDIESSAYTPSPKLAHLWR
jgi:dTMP kinase